MTKNEMNAIAEVFGDLFKQMAANMPAEAPTANEEPEAPKTSKYKASQLQKDTELLDSDQWHMMESHNMHERLMYGELEEENTKEMLSVYTRLVRNHTMCVIYLHQMETCEHDIDEKAFNLMKTAMERFETITADLIDKLYDAIFRVNGIFVDDENDGSDDGSKNAGFGGSKGTNCVAPFAGASFADDFEDDDFEEDEDDDDDDICPCCGCRAEGDTPDVAAVLRVHGVSDEAANDIKRALEALLNKM